MKVVQVLSHFLPDQTAGTEIYTWALSGRLKAKGVEVEIAIPNYGKAELYKYEYDGLSVYKFAEPSIVNRSLIMGFTKPEGLKNFKKYLEEFQPDIVHFQELAGSTGITLNHVKVAKSLGLKVIVTLHLTKYSCITGNLIYKEMETCDGMIHLEKCTKCYLHKKNIIGVKANIIQLFASLFYKFRIDSTTWKNSFGTAFGTYFLIEKMKRDLLELGENAHKVVAITKWYKQILIRNGLPESKLKYIPQGLVTAEPSVVDKKIFIPSGHALKIIFIGRISHFKGIHLLLQALTQIPEDKVSVDFYGQPTESDYYEKCLAMSRRMKNVFWKGTIESKEVINAMRNYDLLCLPSTVCEMSPLVIQEAFAAGLPVLASNVYGNAEQIIENRNGWLFDFNNSNSLRDKIVELINNPTNLQEIKKFISSPTSFDFVADEYYTLYQDLIDSDLS